jgi:hypothetical protein
MLLWQFRIAALADIEITPSITKNPIIRHSFNGNRTDIAIHIPVTDPRRKGVAFGALSLTTWRRPAVDAVENLTLGAHTGIGMLIAAYTAGLSVC